ncbi:hypothetical protein EI42_02668 [Thermosporothrix hazakensis]|jgi:hypothetical protein|uniref:DUF4149 domain-containing protein n=2 Tax=Thermosporothrix TaxID=768650 RepID=A0A326UA54_THEHA|nr:hypothetical protein [Thermosporothrix hazakensis]PZW29374.1 hypothetical protein EI42_02668 [Thermosporothrix hazakensis]BBH85659.1 hypothetical protein KTC_04100 [Thermosporothrix sp. COM3]GCE45912.1 hypothetical protein KTH_07810 [Thermosporothrix hazakensis]
MFVKFLQVALPLLWAGLVFGISFLEAPLKFRAPGITRTLGLGIGRIVFAALNKVEFVLAILLLVAFLLHVPGGLSWLLCVLCLVVLLAQTLWLTPILNRRIVLAQKGTPAPPTYHHWLFIVAEAVKLLLLLALSYTTAQLYIV